MLNWFKRYISLSLVAVLGFVGYVLFFNDYSMSRSIENASEIRRLRTLIAQYEDTLQHYTRLNQMLDTNPAELERIVREYYFMQRKSEDVYICD